LIVYETAGKTLSGFNKAITIRGLDKLVPQLLECLFEAGIGIWQLRIGQSELEKAGKPRVALLG
jgi:hypothetical protein